MIQAEAKRTVCMRHSQNVCIRTVFLADINDVYADGLNDSEVTKYLTGRNKRYTHDQVKQYVLEQTNDLNCNLFGLFIDDELQGTSRVHDIDLRKSSAWLGIALFNKKLQGKGYATILLENVVNYLFHELCIASIFSGILVENHISKKLFRRVGFKSCGIDPSFPSREIWVRNKQ